MCLLNVNQATAQIDQTTSKLQVANTAVNQAFSAVLDAEKAGANVTDLLFQLNYAQDVLAKAENSYRIGDLNEPETKQTTYCQLHNKSHRQLKTLNKLPRLMN